MPIIKEFMGLAPRYPTLSKVLGTAEVAHNVNIIKGSLNPWREKKHLEPALETSESFFAYDSRLVSWDKCVTATAYMPDYNRIFITGRNNRAEVISAQFINDLNEYQFLGLPQPGVPPVIEATENFGEDCDSRSYVYTYVNGYGEESAPSPVSDSLTVRDKQPVLITLPSAVPDGWGIIGINIYRSSTGSRLEVEAEQNPLTDFFFVGTVTLGETIFEDTIALRNHGLILNTAQVREPPYGLKHVRHIKGTGLLVGATDNQIHFSENFQPYNWPVEYDMTLPSNIVNLVTVDKAVFVSTDSVPYVVDASNFCESMKSKPVEDVNVPLSDISCGHHRSAIATPFGMVYPSLMGLILVKSNATYEIITSSWLTKEQWLKFKPETTRLAYWEGRLFVVTDVISFILYIDAKTTGDAEYGLLTTISDRPKDMLVTDNGSLLMLEDNSIWQWDSDNTYRPYEWESANIDFNAQSTPQSVEVDTDGIKFTLLVPDKELSTSKFIMGFKPVRLERLGFWRFYRVRFEGIGKVDQVKLGTSYKTLMEGK
jgi:hypothetical protein